MLQINYDDVQKFVKHFRDEAEDTAQMLSDTRQRVQDLHSEWTGEAADAFFAEMEGELLPALKRLSEALLFSHDRLGNIMKIIHNADQEAAGNFKNDDFGAGLFNEALGAGGGTPGSTPGGLPGAPGSGDDFGASQFGAAAPGGGAPGGSGDDFGASQFGQAGETGPGQTPNAKNPIETQEVEEMEPEETAETPAPTGGGGGGGGGSGGSGFQGELNLGAGMVGAQQSAAVGGVNPDLPDHDFGGSSGGGGGSTPPQPGGPSGGSGGPTPPQTGSGGAAAGVAGVAGSAAVGAAAKIINDKKKDNE